MKIAAIQSIVTMVILGVVVIVLAFTHNGSLAAAPPVHVEPQIIVMMPTPEAELGTETTAVAESESLPESDTSVAQVEAPAPTKTPAPTATPEQAADAAAEPASFEAGTLLRGEGADIFYITEAGTRLRVYSPETLAAFGFTDTDVIRVAQADLDAIPQSGELTQLLQDPWGSLFWLADGKLYAVERWQEVVNRDGYAGVPVTVLDESLQKRLPLASTLSNGTLLQSGDTVYYLLNDSRVPVMVGNNPVITTDPNGQPVIPGDIVDARNEANIVTIPSEMLDLYHQGDWRYQVVAEFNDETLAANLRQGPGLDQNVVKIITRNDGLIKATAKTADGYWLYVTNQEAEGWLAADLIRQNPALNLLPLANNTAEVSGGTVQTAAAAASTDSQPIYCYETPIRGFGKVWGDHPEVQQKLRCPSQYREQGTKAAVQNFQNGWMLWLENDSRYYGDPVYVFFNDGTYQRFGDLGAADPAKVGTTPSGFFAVGDKFSKVYWEGTGARVKERLGYATNQPLNSDGAYQQFNNGRMFWAGTIDQIFVIYDYWTRDENNNRVQVRTWESYEDKF